MFGRDDGWVALGETAGCSGFGKLWSEDRQSPASGDLGRQRRSRAVHHSLL